MLSPDEIDNDLEGSVLLRKGTSTQIRQRFERIRLGIEFGLLLVLAVLSTLLLLPSPVMRDLSVAPGPHGESMPSSPSSSTYRRSADASSPDTRHPFHAEHEICLRQDISIGSWSA